MWSMSQSLAEIQCLLDLASIIFESNDGTKHDIVSRKRAFDALDLVSNSIKKNKIKDRKIITKMKSLRSKYDKTYHPKQKKIQKPPSLPISDKYMKIQSIFTDSADHREFALILQSIEQSPFKRMPLIINKHIAEFSTGKINNCFVNDCKNEIFILNANKNQPSPYHVYCSKTDRYWCKNHMIYTQDCEQCEAIKWIPDSIACDAFDCIAEDVYICENIECCNFVNRERERCNICNKIFCRSWEHEEELGLYHCHECKNLCCMECWIDCQICNKMLCTNCGLKYTFECNKKSSKHCGEYMGIRVNHPLCKQDCKCYVEQENVCLCCLKHSCRDWRKIKCIIRTLDDWNTDCKGNKCNICKAIMM